MTGPRKNSLMRRVKGFMLRRGPYMIACEDFEAFIIDYLEGGLSDRQRFIFELHIKICRECRDYLAAYQRARELGKATVLEESEAPEDLIQAILKARET
ncbi:MAG: zf-HC2 domain-containing protein [Pseudomonadota bacterium]